MRAVPVSLSAPRRCIRLSPDGKPEHRTLENRTATRNHELARLGSESNPTCIGSQRIKVAHWSGSDIRGPRLSSAGRGQCPLAWPSICEGCNTCAIFVLCMAARSATMAATTTIRLPPKLRARLGSLAKQTGRSAHSLIVEAVERHTSYEEQMRSLVKEALAADSEIDKTGEVYRAEDVHAWMKRLATDESAPRPKPWRR